MANHFTPEELAQEMGTDTRDVIQLCVKEGIPIYKGKIDRSLLTAVMWTRVLAVAPAVFANSRLPAAATAATPVAATTRPIVRRRAVLVGVTDI